WAAEKGHYNAVETLLVREDVNPNMLNSEYGQTQLYLSVENGDEVVVKTLLVVNHNMSDTKYSRTPLYWPAQSGPEAVIKILLV
ncbi:hypothetical protein L873DRAFT_1677537, partial [Choiromyces venosus 120613-1]